MYISNAEHRILRTSSDIFFAILGHRRHKNMMSGKHHILFFLVGLTCGFFLQSDAASRLNVNLKIDVNGKTVIDQSLPTSKLFRFLLMVLYKNYTYNKSTFVAEVAYDYLFFRHTKERTQVYGFKHRIWS